MAWFSLLVALLAAGCGAPSPSKGAVLSPSQGTVLSPSKGAVLSPPKGSDRPVSLADALPGAGAISGWTPTGEVQVFDAGNLYDLVNGQADAFFAYAFEQVAVGDYENAEGGELRVEVWQLATPVDAYGLFTTYRVGTPVTVGASTDSARRSEGDADPGRRLDFWQDRYFVRLFARQPLPDADLRAFADALAVALPAGGEPPSLVGRLPSDGLVARSAVFFRQEISIQSTLWLGGENLLGLSPETEGVLARYDVAGATAHLVLVQYPDAASATAGLDALQRGQVDGLVTALARENLLGAVFGALDKAAADELVALALQG